MIAFLCLSALHCLDLACFFISLWLILYLDFLRFNFGLLFGTFNFLLLASLIFSDLFQLSDLSLEQLVVKFNLSDLSFDLGYSFVHIVLLDAKPQS